MTWASQLKLGAPLLTKMHVHTANSCCPLRLFLCAGFFLCFGVRDLL